MPIQYVWEFPFFICTADDPWTKDKDGGLRVSHHDAADIGDRDYGGGCYCVRYRCPHCNKSFEVELPQ